MRLTAQEAQAFHIPRWDELPAIALYMDQLVIVMKDAIGIFVDEKDDVVTRSMVNNYVKQKLINPPEKKKYGKNHLAALIVVNILKKVFSMTEITEIISLMIDSCGLEAAYDRFCSRLEESVRCAFSEEGELIAAVQPGDRAQVAMDAAITAFMGKVVTQNRLDEKREDEPPA